MIVSIDLGVGEDVMKDCLGDVREVIVVVAYLRSEQMRSRGLRAVPCPHWNPRARIWLEAGSKTQPDDCKLEPKTLKKAQAPFAILP